MTNRIFQWVESSFEWGKITNNQLSDYITKYIYLVKRICSFFPLSTLSPLT